MNSERDRLILREVVETHIASGEAVGSKIIAQRLDHALSSASIRSVMSRLCGDGLLHQPHTSAGRVPTDRGYRAYLDEVYQPVRLTEAERFPLDALAWGSGHSVVDVLRQAARVLGAQLGVAALVFGPRLESARLHTVELVHLRPGRVLAIVVTRTGLVHERLVHTAEDLDRSDLEALTNFLNALLPGCTLSQARARIAAEQERDRAAHDEAAILASRALELGRQALEHAADGDEAMCVDGASRILITPEFVEAPSKAAQLVEAIAQRAAWLELIDRVIGADDTEVYIGRETARPALESCALVARSYGSAGARGVVALLGPKRMDYRRAVPIVGVVADRLSAVLDDSSRAKTVESH